MKLPKLSIRLPSLPLPFLKRRGGGDVDADDDFDDPLTEPGDDSLDADPGDDATGDPDQDHDAGPVLDGAADDAGSEDDSKQSGRWKRVAGTVGVGLLAVLVLGGTGGLIGWLWVNAEHTEAMRAAAKPQLTVPILAEGEPAEPNSSDGSMDAEMADEKGAGSAADDPMATPVESTDGVRLAPVDPALLELKDDAKLPIIGVDGRQVWSAYARPFNHDDTRPRIALVITNLGIGKDETEVAITGLPGAVTLSFSPYSRDLENWVDRARRAGHEAMIDLPLEPLDFPRDDPGPHTLLTSLSTVDNLNRLEWVLGRAPGYIGVTTWMGSQFTTVEDALMPVLEGLKERGLMFVDSRGSSRSIATELASSIQLPRAFNNRFIDATPSIAAIDRALADLEVTARQNRYAIGIAQPYPVTLDRLARWGPSLEAKGIALAPVSAIANRQRLR